MKKKFRVVKCYMKLLMFVFNFLTLYLGVYYLIRNDFLVPYFYFLFLMYSLTFSCYLMRSFPYFISTVMTRPIILHCTKWDDVGRFIY